MNYDWTTHAVAVINANNDCTIDVPAFTGVFDGKNHKITGFKPTGELAAGTTFGLFPVIKGATIKNVNLTLREGETAVLVGLNGAGKTTILKMICGLSTPTSGSVTFMGKKGAALSAHKKDIGSLIETPGLFPKMSAFQNVKLKCLSLGINDNKYIHSLLEQVGLSNVGKKPVQSFSLGMKQRLGIAMALLPSPEITARRSSSPFIAAPGIRLIIEKGIILLYA